MSTVKNDRLPQNAVNCWMDAAHCIFKKYSAPASHSSERFNEPFHHRQDAS